MAWVKYIGTTVDQESPVGKAGVAGVFTVQPGDVIQVPSDVATYLTTNESSKWQTASDPTQVSKHIATSNTAAPTAAAGSNAGTSPPAPVVVSGSDDNRGQITFGTGTLPAAGAEATVTFNTAYASTPIVTLTPANTATQALGLYVSSASKTGFAISTTNAPAASQGNSVYAVNYHVIG